MIDFGSTLQAAREARGLSIEQVSDQTHLLTQVIEGLENEDFSRIAAPIYGRGFVKLYCEAVGIDPQPMVEEFMAIYNGKREPKIRERRRFFSSSTKSAPPPKPIADTGAIDSIVDIPAPPEDEIANTGLEDGVEAATTGEEDGEDAPPVMKLPFATGKRNYHNSNMSLSVLEAESAPPQLPSEIEPPRTPAAGARRYASPNAWSCSRDYDTKRKIPWRLVCVVLGVGVGFWLLVIAGRTLVNFLKGTPKEAPEAEVAVADEAGGEKTGEKADTAAANGKNGVIANAEKAKSNEKAKPVAGKKTSGRQQLDLVPLYID